MIDKSSQEEVTGEFLLRAAYMNPAQSKGFLDIHCQSCDYRDGCDVRRDMVYAVDTGIVYHYHVPNGHGGKCAEDVASA